MGFQSRLGQKDLVRTLSDSNALLDQIRAVEDPKDVAPEPITGKFLGTNEFREGDLARRAQFASAKSAARFDPAVHAILPQLDLNLFTGRDPIQAALWRSTSGRTLSAAERKVAMALAGTLDSVELQHWQDFADLKQLPKGPVGSGTRGWIESAMTFPPFAIWMAYWFLGVGGAPFSLGLFASLGLSLTAGKYLLDQSTSHKGDWRGVNPLEGETQNELLRLFDHFSDSDRYKGDPAAVREQLSLDLALIDVLFELRAKALAESGRAETPREKEVVAQFKQYAETLRSLGDGESAIQQANAARKKLLKGIEREELFTMASGIRPEPIVDEEQWRKGVNQMLGAMLDQIAAQANPALTSATKYLEAQIDIEKHLDTRSAPRLKDDELALLRDLASDRPSIQELLAVGRLAYAGALDLRDLWPDLDHRIADTGDKFDYRKLTEDLVNLNRVLHESDAKREKWGKLLPVFGWLAGLVGIGWTTFTGDVSFFPGGMLAGYGPPLISHIAGHYLAKEGRQNQLIGGADVAHGGHVYSLHERLYERIGDPGRLLAMDSTQELKEALRKDAAVIQLSINAQANDIALFEGQFDLSALKQLTGLAPSDHTSLLDYAKKLEALASSGPNDLEELKAEVSRAWSSAMSPELWTTIRTEVLRQCATIEQSPGFVHAASKRHLVQQLQEAVKASAESGKPLMNSDLLAVANQVQFARKARNQKEDSKLATALAFIPVIGPLAAPAARLKRAEARRDVLDSVADAIVKNPSGLFDANVLVEPRTNIKKDPENPPSLERVFIELEALRLDNEAELQATPVADPERLAQIPGELLEVVYDRVLSLYYGEDVGGLELKAKVEALDFQGTGDGWGVATSRIGGKKPSEKDGKIEFRMNGQGEVDLASVEIDLGEKLLSELAPKAVARALGVAEADLRAKVLLDQEQPADGEHRRFIVRSKAYGTHTIELRNDGFARFESLTALS